MKLSDMIAITFMDINPEVIVSLSREFGKLPKEHWGCTYRTGDILEHEGGSLVSPSNTIGNMDGGVDLCYAERFPGLEQRLMQYIGDYRGGRMELGSAIVVPTNDSRFPQVVFAPTVVRPGDPASEESVYQAMAAVLTAAISHNAGIEMRCVDIPRIDYLLVPGMGTGYGNLHPAKAACQMAQAYYRISSNLDTILRQVMAENICP
jgi:O-acetyl-ADP-ribose deacetylase (regulator of RNase III)